MCGYIAFVVLFCSVLLREEEAEEEGGRERGRRLGVYLSPCRRRGLKLPSLSATYLSSFPLISEVFSVFLFPVERFLLLVWSREKMNMMRRIKSIASGRTSISSDPVSIPYVPASLFVFVL